MGYRPYRMIRDVGAKAASVHVDKKAWKADRKAFMDTVLMNMFMMDSPTKVMDSHVMVDEEMYVGGGSRMIFPESLALLEMLWRSKMSVTLDDIDWDVVPPAFSVAWPDGSIDGQELQGCMVVVATRRERREWAREFGRQHLRDETAVAMMTECIPLTGTDKDDERGLYLTHLAPDGSRGDALFRCCLPEEDLAMCLDTYKGFLETMSGYGPADRSRLAVLGFQLNDREAHSQFVMVRLVMRLMVYMQACPDMVRGGYPTRKGAKTYRSGFSGAVNGTVAGVPAGLGGTHASPSTHWRTWHFRTYPKKKDGTKRKGFIKIDGTIVNADVDPVTASGGKG